MQTLYDDKRPLLGSIDKCVYLNGRQPNAFARQYRTFRTVQQFSRLANLLTVMNGRPLPDRASGH